MKKILKALLILLIVLTAVTAWFLFGSGTGFSSQKEYFYIRSGAATKNAVLDSIKKNNLVSNLTVFNFLANRFNYWENIKPGKYEIKKGDGLLSIVRMLRNGRQSEVKLVINKLRTKEDLSKYTGSRFEFDSSQMMAFLNNKDSLKAFAVDTETAFCALLPDTYSFLWNTTPAQVFRKLYDESKKFWTDERKAKASTLGLSQNDVYILSSIVEEETNHNEEKDTIASVYLNRLKKGMVLGADPTIKYALRDFSITWIHGEMLNVASPYNTYKNKGLPPGPICTPSKKTIDAVLAAPQTNYLFFVANSAFNGTHLFSKTFEEHLAKAKAFQEEDKRRRSAKQNAQKP